MKPWQADIVWDPDGDYWGVRCYHAGQLYTSVVVFSEEEALRTKESWEEDHYI